MQSFAQIVKVFIILLVVDSGYLYSTSTLFGETVKNIQHSSMNIRYGSVFVVYALLAYGLIHFVKRSVKDAAILGAVIYGVFDFTNYAMFRDYGLHIAIMDTIWGSILMATTTYIYSNIL